MLKLLFTTIGVLIVTCSFNNFYAQRVETIRFSTPQAMDGLYVDASGQLYATGGYLGDKLYKIDPATNSYEVFASGFGGPIHLVKSRNGEVYATDFLPGQSIGSVSRVNENGVAEPIAQLAEGPSDIVEDTLGNLFVTHFGNVNTGNGNSVSMIAPDSTVSVHAFGGLLAAPVGIVLTEDGAMYTANIGDGRIVKIRPDGSQELFASLPRRNPFTIGHLAYHEGTLYASQIGANQVHAFDINTGVGRVVAGTGSPGSQDGSAAESTFRTPNGIAVSVTGDTIFVTDADPVANGRNQIRMIIFGTSTTKEPEYLRKGALQVAPNPAINAQIEVKLVLAKAAQLKLELMNINGQRIAVKHMDAKGVAYSHVFDQKQLPAGSYIVRASVGSESVSAVAVVK